MGDEIDIKERFMRLCVRSETLEPFGFRRDGAEWKHEAPIMDGAFSCVITIDGSGGVSERVIDCATGDEYVQHRVAAATGAFVGRVRQEVDAILERIAAACFERDVFKTDLAQHMIAFARETWGDELEFLWKQFPDYAVLRRKDTDKWYALVARLTADKVGGNKKEVVEIVNLRRTEGMDAPRFLPAYHMNKKTWATIVLDETIPSEELMRLLSASRDNAI